jgi:hypothetical protein
MRDNIQADPEGMSDLNKQVAQTPSLLYYFLLQATPSVPFRNYLMCSELRKENLSLICN